VISFLGKAAIRKFILRVNPPKIQCPLRSKEDSINGTHYNLCLNTKQDRKDTSDRQALVEPLRDKIKKDCNESLD